MKSDPSTSIDNTCTFWPDGSWLHCCVAHDYGCADAACRKSEWERRQADYELRRCVSATGHPAIAWVMWAGVRVWAILKGGY